MVQPRRAQRVGERHRLGVGLLRAAFGRIDDSCARFGEILFELAQVREQPLFGVHRTALPIGDALENRAVAHDLFPLLLLNRNELSEFRGPHIVVARSRQVCEPI